MLRAMDERGFHATLALGVMVTAALVFVTLFFLAAPYGRHTRGGWGRTLPARWGWLVMESPAALGFAVVYAWGQHWMSPAPLVLAALWLTHYLHRAFVYPFRLRNPRKPMPAAVVGLAILFNLVNAYLNGRWISQLGAYPLRWLVDPRFLTGAAAFVFGMVLNVRSDNLLFGLRRPGDEGYRIPEGGAYRLVSAPNYTGELIEWAGWALASWSLAGLAFALFTFANLVPRAVAHHRWYRRTFPDYPPERRAVIPWVL
jgi:protein-S-isoprenylcysteine O-methyltransferase Ste14